MTQKVDFMIGNVPVSGLVALAPMAGITDVVFRKLAYRYGAAFTVSEMVATKEFIKGSTGALLRAEMTDDIPQVIQVSGCDAVSMAEVAKMAEAMGAHVVDINMGCPSKKVVGGLAGSALMRDLDLATQIITCVVQAVKIPVTLKMRLGWDETSINADQLAHIAQEQGVSCVTVHGRTRNQKYHGKADWKAIGKLIRGITIPVIANGDIVTVQNARECLKMTNSQALMIGRAAIGKPWLPGMIDKGLREKENTCFDIKEKICIMTELYEGILGFYGRQTGIRHARKHLAVFVKDLQCEGYNIEKDEIFKVLTLENPDYVLKILSRWGHEAEIPIING